MTAITAQNTRKSAQVPLRDMNASDETLVTITLTAEELIEISEALRSRATSWQVEKNTAKGKANIHWSKKDFITDGQFLFVGGMAKSYYKKVGKTRAINKFALIKTLSERIKEAVQAL